MGAEEGFSSIYDEKKPGIFDRFKKSEPEFRQEPVQRQAERPVQEEKFVETEKDELPDMFLANFRSAPYTFSKSERVYTCQPHYRI